MDNNAFTSLFLFFVTTTVIIIAAYYVTRFIGQRAAVYSKKKHVGLLEKSILPGNLSIEIVKIADKVYVLACRGKDVTLLDQYSMDQWLEMKSASKTTEDEAHLQNSLNPYRNTINYLKKESNLIGMKKRVKKGD